MRVLFICFANVARSQVAEHISKRSHNMICHNPGIAVDHLIRPNNLPSRKLKQVPFPERPIDYINRAMDFLLRQIVTKTHFPILSGTPISLCNTTNSRGAYASAAFTTRVYQEDRCDFGAFVASGLKQKVHPRRR